MRSATSLTAAGYQLEATNAFTKQCSASKQQQAQQLHKQTSNSRRQLQRQSAAATNATAAATTSTTPEAVDTSRVQSGRGASKPRAEMDECVPARDDANTAVQAADTD